ncbi:MAG TPA: glycosyltransferase family 2 protein [Acidimicrobiales bacterium]|nr:glycosyltransferase family 2 protein [Acidimicrobiales bacterium]
MTADPLRGVAAIVVNYNAAGHIGACLRSIAAGGVHDIVVVDNDSSDDSQNIVLSTGAHWVPAGANLGYGRAANLGAQAPPAAEAEYLLVCNPDVELFPGAVAELVQVLDRDPSVGVVGPAISNPDGSLYPSARTFPDMVDAVGHGLLGPLAPENRFTRRYRLLDWDHASLANVDWVSGACFVARRKAWDAVGGFDPAYFMYMEDVDLCWRMGHAGWGIAYQPSAAALHVQGVSADRHPYRMLAAHHRSMWRFALRTTGGTRRALLPLVGVGLLARLGVVSALHRFGRPPPGLTPPPSRELSGDD